ncbi:MAG: hypothetical protein QM752_00030 [Gammaproteobacteria bacterium]
MQAPEQVREKSQVRDSKAVSVEQPGEQLILACLHGEFEKVINLVEKNKWLLDYQPADYGKFHQYKPLQAVNLSKHPDQNKIRGFLLKQEHEYKSTSPGEHLIQACVSGNMEWVKRLVNRNKELVNYQKKNYRGFCEITPVLAAGMCSHLNKFDIIAYLLEQGANPTFETRLKKELEFNFTETKPTGAIGLDQLVGSEEIAEIRKNIDNKLASEASPDSALKDNKLATSEKSPLQSTHGSAATFFNLTPQQLDKSDQDWSLGKMIDPEDLFGSSPEPSPTTGDSQSLSSVKSSTKG